MIPHEKKFKIDSVAVNILIPYLGTEFYRKFEKEGRIICIDYTKYKGNTVIIRPKNKTVDQLHDDYNRFTRDYYKIMETVYRALKQLNAVAKITGLISKCDPQAELHAREIGALCPPINLCAELPMGQPCPVSDVESL